jgi:hypothetical protein
MMQPDLKDLLERVYHDTRELSLLHHEYVFSSLAEREQMMNEYIQTQKYNMKTFRLSYIDRTELATVTAERDHARRLLDDLSVALGGSRLYDPSLLAGKATHLVARLATVTAQRDALVPLAWAWASPFSIAPTAEDDATARAALAAIRAERATTGGTDADE